MPELTQALAGLRDLTSNLVAIPFLVCFCMAVYGLLLRRAAR